MGEAGESRKRIGTPLKTLTLTAEYRSPGV